MLIVRLILITAVINKIHGEKWCAGPWKCPTVDITCPSGGIQFRQMEYTATVCSNTAITSGDRNILNSCTNQRHCYKKMKHCNCRCIIIQYRCVVVTTSTTRQTTTLSTIDTRLTDTNITTGGKTSLMTSTPTTDSFTAVTSNNAWVTINSSIISNNASSETDIHKPLSHKPGDEGISLGLVLGLTAALLLVIVLLLAFVCIRRKRMLTKERGPSSTPAGETIPTPSNAGTNIYDDSTNIELYDYSLEVSPSTTSSQYDRNAYSVAEGDIQDAYPAQNDESYNRIDFSRPQRQNSNEGHGTFRENLDPTQDSVYNHISTSGHGDINNTYSHAQPRQNWVSTESESVSAIYGNCIQQNITGDIYNHLNEGRVNENGAAVNGDEEYSHVVRKK